VDEKLLITVREAARLLGISRTSMFALVRRNRAIAAAVVRLPGVRALRFDPRRLHAAILTHGNESRAEAD